MQEPPKPQLGQIVKIARGRDSGKYAIIIGIVDQRFVMVADGNKRKFDRPKKKNVIHLQLQDLISNEAVESLIETGRVTNSKLRFALNRFTDEEAADAQKEGE